MSIKLVITTLLFISFSTTNVNQLTETENKTATQQPHVINLELPDKLKIETINDTENDNTLFEKNMPWVAALLIGIISAIVNIKISNDLKRSNEVNISNQISGAQENIKLQIESDKESTLTQFKATVATKNRQEWINELRDTLSQYLSYTIMMIQEDSFSEDDKRSYLDKIYQTKFKIELMTNPEKKEHKALMDAVNKMILVVNQNKDEIEINDLKSARQEFIITSRKIFIHNWNKIKDLK
ncbi:hypothetical protein [Winogradskyella sp. R77965]|uniref:hypothetical protein n=1 Tax=Winogradskyella sp. R77965 TaxID=3093872 RepID=UPI0037DD3409